jgi:thiamine biosynthesis lipoprotein
MNRCLSFRPTLFFGRMLCLLAMLAGCGPDSATSPAAEIQGLAMGTSWSVKVAAVPPVNEQRELSELIAARIEDIEQSMSTYRTDSELSRFNTYAGDDWYAVSAELCQVVDTALTISRRTRGAFDVTVGPLVELWGFGPGEPVVAPPDPMQIQAAMRGVGYEKLAVDCGRPALRKSVAGLHVDLSGIAKGYAVDAVAALLDARDIGDYLVEIGGDLRARGRNGFGEAWSIGIESPDRSARRVQRIIHLPDLAMASSGDYRNYFEHDGVYYSHTIDPGTGMPVQHALAEVSVVSATAMEADAWATAMLVLGTAAGRRLADELDLAVLYQERGPDGKMHEQASSAFAELSGRQSQASNP